MRDIKFSQNFVKNKELVESLIKVSSISTNDVVFDIGAGTGEITDTLRKYSKEVIAIEKDKKLYNDLRKRFELVSNVRVINQDVLNYNFPANKNYKIFSNIPFNYTADIIRQLSEQKWLSEDIYLFVQKQVALKYLGEPAESIKSLFIKTHFVPSIVHRFKRNDFKPSPRVEVVLFRLRRLDKFLIDEKDLFEWKNFVVYGFSQFKSTLKESFAKVFTETQFRRLAKDLKFNLQVKPTQLSIVQWLSLYNFFRDNIEARKKNLIRDSYIQLLKQQNSLQKIHRTRTDKDWRDK
jgi:23S rRNA (adenine-N6)-dimethyltransferase